MTPLTVRRIPDQTATAAENMSRDELLLLQAAERGVGSFRLYSWDVPSLSLGYFQPSADRQHTPAIAGMDWVRRSTGGAAIVHDPACEITYSLALPASALSRYDGSMICNVHYIVRDVLKQMNIDSRVVICGEEVKLGPVLCFRHQTAGDLLVNGGKVAGSAQRKWKGALLQHGSILFRTSPLAPDLHGIEELAETKIDVRQFMVNFERQLCEAFDWQLKSDDWTPEELKTSRTIEVEKYGSSDWNQKR
jgi:lipoate-protein ligase A